VNIANELLADLCLLLLDKPTGLDASTAMLVVRLLRDLADEGKTII
jgi:ABC-type multidrug transport system ATPase subunit